LGVKATRLILRGELILAEKPLFTQDIIRTDQTIFTSLTQLDKNGKREFLKLHNCHAGESSIPFRGIFETNCLPLGDNSLFEGHVASTAGIFLVCSRFNSSCTPNVNNYWDGESEQEMMFALRDILEGEELCICYSNFTQPRAERMENLQRKFGFPCTCEACSLTGAELEESDSRRQELADLWDKIGASASNPRGGEVMVRKAIRLAKQERLYVLEHGFYYDGFQFCVSVSDVAHAKAWIKKAYNAAACARGPRSDVALKYKAYLDDPRAHPAFGLMKQSRLRGPDDTA